MGQACGVLATVRVQYMRPFAWQCQRVEDHSCVLHRTPFQYLLISAPPAKANVG